MSAPLLLSIGTTHPWNIAGTGLDARVAAEYGLAHAACVVAVSAQDAAGLHALHAVPPDVVRAQLRAAPPGAGAVRIGALVSSETVREIAAFVAERAAALPVVIDPVTSVSLGGTLAADDSLERALQALLRLPVIVTPNLNETLALGYDGDIAQVTARAAAATWFVANGARAALIKGGHAAGDPVDVLADARGVRTFSASRLPGSMRGTGCTLAAALACELLLGRTLDDAVAGAREYVRVKIAARVMRGGLQVAF
ncbi:MAG: bifunctional hydroxymethylpyrimidine kinase/phosphomethylpyrimidine kinase [Candidatus Baltobacteraceae bacterium]